jgi:hypothetical protein
MCLVLKLRKWECALCSGVSFYGENFFLLDREAAAT